MNLPQAMTVTASYQTQQINSYTFEFGALKADWLKLYNVSWEGEGREVMNMETSYIYINKRFRRI